MGALIKFKIMAASNISYYKMIFATKYQFSCYNNCVDTMVADNCCEIYLLTC